MRHHRWQRLLSSLMAAVMLFTMLSPSAFAAVSKTIGNSADRNAAILAQLEELTGSSADAEAMYTRLDALGVLDEDGWVTENLVIDGVEYTLDEASEIAETLPDDTIVEVGDTAITAEALKTMLAIEKQIQAIRDEWYNGEDWSPEQLESIASLRAALAADDFIVTRESGSPIIGHSGVNHSAQVSVEVDRKQFDNGTPGTATVTLTLTGAAEGQTVSFDYTTLDGSAYAGENYTAASGTNVTLSNDTSYEITVNTRTSDEYWNGNRLFFLQISNLRNACFANGKDSILQTFEISNNSYDTSVIGTNLIPDLTNYTSSDFSPSLNTGSWTISASGGVMSLVARTTNSSEGIQWIYNYGHYQSPENAAPTMSYDLRAARTLLQDNGIDLVGTLGGAEKDKLTVATLDFWDANNQLWAEVDFLKENPQEIIPDDFGDLSRIYPVDGQITYQGLVIDQIPGYAYLSANLSVSLEDCVVPTYVEGSIAAPASGSFTPGMIIPITVTFSEPVIGGTAKAVVNGQTLTAAEDADTFSRRQTFLYEVKPLDNESIAVTELSGAKDYGDHVAEAVKPGGDNGTVLCSGLLSSEYVQGKIDSVVMDQQEYAPYDTEGTLTVNLADLGAEVEQESTFWANTKLTAVLDDGTEIPLTLEEPESGTFVFTGTVPFGANSTEQEINRTVELYFQENEGERQLYFGKAAAFTQLPAQYLDNTEFSIQTTNFPAEDETIFADQEAVLGVQAVLAQGATGTWSDVTDPDQFTWGVEVWQQGADGAGQWVADATGSVASIVPDGEDASKATVALGSSGKFRVTLTAHNGDTADTPADQRHAVTVYSSAVTVGLGNNPILRIAPNLQSISIQSGQDAILRWTSNLTEKQQELGNPSQTFKIEVFQALDSNYQRPEDGAAPDLADVSKWKALEPITADSTPEQTLSTYALSGLTQVSVTGGYSYAIRLSGEYAGTTYTAYAYVAVSSRPAVVELEQPALYWTERTGAGGVDLRWTVRNFDTANETSTDFSVTVLNNDTGMVVASGGKETLSGSGDDRSGSLHFDFSTLQQGNWREAYTVELRARNDTESTWSYDSAVLYYYDDSAFQIYVNGAPAEDSLTMSNEKNPVDGTDKTVAAMTRDEILALGRNIALSDEIGINPLVPWGNVTDQVNWTVSGGAASLNYRQGTLYENINLFDYDSYNPKTVFMLSGLQDGTTTLSAAHKTAADVLNDVLTVNVETLKDKLYLFRLYPAAEQDNGTVLEYVNGDGQEKTIYANASGEAAVYEPSGIASDVSCRSTIDGTPYVGTIPQENLVSGETDSTQLELYPLNTLKLREVSSAQLYLKDETGKPYANKQLTIHAGVYKNGVYCQDARFTTDRNGSATTSGSGDGFTARTDADGRLSLYMDATQFYTLDEAPGTELDASDQLRFMFEVEMTEDGTEYYPQLISCDAMMSQSENVRFGESIVSLSRNESAGEHPFIVSQSVEMASGKERNLDGYTGSIGPSTINQSGTLHTEVYWWGLTDAEDNTFVIKDSVGTVAPGQTAHTQRYEFTDSFVTKSTVTLDGDNLDEWIPPKASRSLTYTYLDGDGSLLRADTSSFRVVNMVNVPDPVRDPDSKENLQQLIEELLSQLEQQAGEMAWAANDAVLGTAVDMLSGENYELGDMLKLSLFGTEDPTVFRGLFKFSYGEDITIQEDDEKGYKNSLDSISDTTEDLMSLTEMKSEIRKYNRGKAVKGLEPSVYVAGYLESEICYKDGHWHIYLLNGGIGASGGISYNWKINTNVGPFPFTAEFTMGAGLGVELGVGADRVNDLNYYLTELRLAAYFRAFAGMGWDFTIIAAKVGLFGEVQLAFQARWFNEQGAKTIYGNMNGQNLEVNGEVGIEAYAKFLFWSYRRVLASWPFNIADRQYGKWNEIEDAWENVSQGRSEYTSADTRMYYNPRTGQTLYASPSVVEVENRDYLEKYDRAWNPGSFGLSALARALDIGADSGIDETWTNAYPYAEPALTEDGQIMVYLDDMNSTDVEATRAAFSVWDGGEFSPGSAIDSGEGAGHGDSQIAVSGDKDFAVSAWVRMTDSLGAQAGETITENEQAAAMNASDIMVSVYDGGSWTTQRLTENSTPDLSPVVAANGGKAIAVWRAVSASDMEYLTRFDTGDSILYAVYENGSWSEAKTLYNGTSGAVKGLEAAMMEDGTAAVVYSIDTNDKPLASEALGRSARSGQANGDNTGLEVVYAVIDDLKGEAQAQRSAQQGVSNVRLTYDDQLDENPQITATQIDGEAHFVIGWSRTEVTEENSTTDLALRAVKADGTLRSDMPDSIAEMAGGDGVRMTSNFRFAQNSGTIDNLSIVWVEPIVETAEDASEDTPGVDKDRLMAVKLSANADGGGSTAYGLTVPVEMALMPDYTTIDSFDVYVNEESDLRAVILGTNYGQGYRPAEDGNGGTLQVQNEDGTTSDVFVADAESTLYTATGSYTNEIGIDEAVYEQTEVMPGYTLPVQVTVTNRGIQPITSLSVAIGGKPAAAADNISLAPGEKMTLTASYQIPQQVEDAACTVTAAFAGGGSAAAEEMLALSTPDVGISRMDLIRQEDGQRVLQVALYSATEVPLDSRKHIVKLNLFSDSACTSPLLDQAVTLSDSDLELVNEGGYSMQLTADIADFVKNTLHEDEIPDGGVQIYAKVWIEAKPAEGGILSGLMDLFADEQDDAAQAETVSEVRASNNTVTTNLTSLLEQHNGAAATVASVLDNSGSGTRVTVTVQNNSLSNKTSGNLIVSLLDEDGNVMEQQQSYQAGAENQGLIQLQPEELVERTFVFTQKGASVQVSYSDAVLQNNANTSLSAVTLEGVELTYDAASHTYTGEHHTTGGALLTATPEDPRAQVSIGGSAYDAQTGKLTLTGGTVSAEITVTAQDGTQQTYTLQVTGDGTQTGGDDTEDDTGDDTEDSGGSGSASGSSAGSNRYTVSTADDIENGSISVSPSRAARGDTVTITVQPDAGYALHSLTVLDSDGDRIALEQESDTRYTFEMPSGRVTIEAAFAEIETQPVVPPFTDVSQDDWFYDAVAYVYENGIMNGMGEGRFGPNGTTSRAMVVTILYRLAGSPDLSNENLGYPFADVDAASWYGDAVYWARLNGIANGISGTDFGPNGSITREQMAALLYRYADFAGYDVSAGGTSLSEYADASEISRYAVTAMQWANENGLITGRSATALAPKGTATRAEAAAILMRFCEEIAVGA